MLPELHPVRAFLHLLLLGRIWTVTLVPICCDHSNLSSTLFLIPMHSSKGRGTSDCSWNQKYVEVERQTGIVDRQARARGLWIFNVTAVLQYEHQRSYQ